MYSHDGGVFVKIRSAVCLYTSLTTLLYSYLFLLLSFTRECISTIHDKEGVLSKTIGAVRRLYTSLLEVLYLSVIHDL
jgi:hypothetical protein